MQRLTIAILFGGCSEEHDVSVKSAIEIARNVDVRRYDPMYVGIGRSGAWSLCDGPSADWERRECRPVVLSPDRTTHGLLFLEHGGYRPVRVDVVFPVLHGRSGEDGAVQGLLELSGIPYVGCDIQSSAICMDKSLAYVVARSAGIDTPDCTVVHTGHPVVAEQLSFPVYVKPARSGSSFGVTRVEQAGELEAAVAEAGRYDTKVLVEEAILGLEVGCAVLGRGTELVVGEVDQIELRHGIFRIHQEEDPEHGSENAVITVPADLPSDVCARVQETARSVYSALGCQGLARVDMFLLADGGIVLNEVNTMPGFTSYSRYPRMMAAAGIDGAELFDRCIALALTR